METVLEDVLVAVVVVGCAGFSAWRLLSARLRLRALDLAASALGRLGEPWITRLRTRTLAKLGGACGSCSHNPAAPAIHRR